MPFLFSVPSTLRAHTGWSNFRILNPDFFAKFWSMNLPPALESIRPRRFLHCSCSFEWEWIIYSSRSWRWLHCRYREKEILTLRQLSCLKTLVVSLFEELCDFVFFHFKALMCACNSFPIILLGGGVSFLFLFGQFRDMCPGFLHPKQSPDFIIFSRSSAVIWQESAYAWI